MNHFPTLSKNFNFTEEEKSVLELWDRIDAFKRSIKQKKSLGATPYSFYDGPPFATGLPHYGHLVASSIKDTVARYWTMRGHYVERRFGWDTHGLPIEMETEKSLGLSGPHSIREYGIGKFNEACRSGVLKYTQEWRRVIRRLGRWVDFDNDYKTLDRSFMESVWWVFSELWKKDLVYQGFRVMPYSVRLSTPLSNFEANLNYQEVQDPAVTIKAELKDEANTFLLIWTTTPWTLPSNLAIAVGNAIDYLKVKQKGDENNYIVAEALAEKVFKNGFKIVQKLKGSDLVGRSYHPIYSHTDYASALGNDLSKCFKVIASDHVTTENGTGLVHMAPAFGADDFEACKKEGIPFLDPIDEEGKFYAWTPKLLGLNFKDADKAVLKTLKEEHKVFDHSVIVHSYPFCWRSNTPLMYKAVPVWFINVPKIKERMSRHNESIHWVPEAIGHKRFARWLEDASDWSVSRNRFWGTPIPIWHCKACDHKICLSSAQELEEKSGAILDDLHSHFIDGLEIPCSQCGSSMQRISEVFDCWFESGSMPVAQIHYPFENQEFFNSSFPADFIAEGLDQTRGWFYTLLVISTALFDKPPFKNVIVNGMVLAADGAKMSKSKKNYPDPEHVINEYGSDALRAYLIGSPVVRAEPLQFKEQDVKEIVRSVLLPLFNSWSFFVQYANLDAFDPKDINKALSLKDRPEIDRWIISKLQSLIAIVNKEMSGYYLYKTIQPILSFIDDLTNWYIRRSRRRFWKNADSPQEHADKLAAYATLYEVLTTFAKTLAPILPFLSEMLYQNLVVHAGLNKSQEDSVHLCDFPQADPAKIDHKLEEHIRTIRQVVNMGRALREKYRLKTRQPLLKITVVSHSEDAMNALTAHEELILSELNVRSLELLREDDSLCTLSCRPNFKHLGPRVGKDMKTMSQAIAALSRAQLQMLEAGDILSLNGYHISIDDVTIVREAVKDVVVMNEDHITVALDTEINQELRYEGIMRDALSTLQRHRKALGLEVSDRIKIYLSSDNDEIIVALKQHQNYLASELLASDLTIEKALSQDADCQELMVDNMTIWTKITKA
ncbi:MAG: isoleucine--tRNA ligase [Myxococcales bacterium]|nr:isoleucine--tRNA ligase [Myxococcales bacterium]USN51675.1 MAG: isoleucine--tRNA ligase [Myxococcales bacterium]